MHSRASCCPGTTLEVIIGIFLMRTFFETMLQELFEAARLHGADFSEWLMVKIAGGESLPLSTADIAYWGHHPVADLVCRFESKGLGLGIRAFAPLILGNCADSNIPAALFDIKITQ